MLILVCWLVTPFGNHPEDGSDIFLRKNGSNVLDHGVKLSRSRSTDILIVFEDMLEDHKWIEET
jgi:hypothetical protein